jgi:hypothetical protein
VLACTQSMINNNKTDGLVFFYENKRVRYRFFVDSDAANEWITFYTNLVASSDVPLLKENLDKIYVEDNFSALPIEGRCEVVNYNDKIYKNK